MIPNVFDQCGIMYRAKFASIFIACFVLTMSFDSCERGTLGPTVYLPKNYEGLVVVVDGKYENLRPMICSGIAFITIPIEKFSAWGYEDTFVFKYKLSNGAYSNPIAYYIGGTTASNIVSRSTVQVIPMCIGNGRGNANICASITNSSGYMLNVDGIWSKKRFLDGLKKYLAMRRRKGDIHN